MVWLVTKSVMEHLLLAKTVYSNPFFKMSYIQIVQILKKNVKRHSEKCCSHSVYYLHNSLTHTTMITVIIFLNVLAEFLYTYTRKYEYTVLFLHFLQKAA